MESNRYFDYLTWPLKRLAFLCALPLFITCTRETGTEDRAFYDRLQPAPSGSGFQMDGYWVWGMSVIRGDDGLYHGFASRWPRTVPFSPNWVTNSEIVHATAERPEGPYNFQSVVFERRGKAYWDGEMTHNPTIHKSGDTYLLFYIGTTYDFPFPDDTVDFQLSRIARANQRIGMATSSSPWGPWERPDDPVLQPRPGKWDALITVNPAPCVKPDGSILLVYKSTASQTGLLKLGVAGTDHYTQPFERLVDGPIFQFDGEGHLRDRYSKHVEDPYIWWNGNRYELVMKDMNGNICGVRGGGIHATSEDGIQWTISDPPLAYTKDIALAGGDTLRASAVERPQLLVQDGVPINLFLAIGTKENAARGGYHSLSRSWNICIPLK
jgi:hypothetical protein